MPKNAATESLLKLLDPDQLNLILIRHGQAGGPDTRKRHLGSTLTPLGKQQAAKVARRLASFPLDAIYASDLVRADQTAGAIRAFHPKTPFRSLSDIREISGFQIRGRPQARKTLERIRSRDEGVRVKRFAEHLRKNHKPGQRVAIIAHNGVNGMLLAELAGLPYRRSIFFISCHTSVMLANVSLDSPAVALRLMGCTRHLTPKRVTYMNARIID